MAVGGTLFELESIRAVPDGARAMVGSGPRNGGGDQPGVPHVAEFNASMKKITRGATARNWFRHASVQTLAVINQEKTLDAVKLSRALAGSGCRRKSRCNGRLRSGAGDHELMSTVFVGEAHPPQGDPDKMFTVRNPVPGEKAAGPAEDTGCKIQQPA